MGNSNRFKRIGRVTELAETAISCLDDIVAHELSLQRVRWNYRDIFSTGLIREEPDLGYVGESCVVKIEGATNGFEISAEIRFEGCTHEGEDWDFSDPVTPHGAILRVTNYKRLARSFLRFETEERTHTYSIGPCAGGYEYVREKTLE